MIAEPGDTCKICGTVYTEYTGICGFCGGVEKLRAEIDALREQVARLTAERDAASESREYISILYGEAMVQLNRHRELTARINSDLWANKSRSQEWERRARWLLVEAKFYRFEFKRIRENRDFWRRLESQVELRMFKSERERDAYRRALIMAVAIIHSLGQGFLASNEAPKMWRFILVKIVNDKMILDLIRKGGE